MPRPRGKITQPAEPRRDDPRARLLIELARALGTYGVAAHRLEDAIGDAAAAMGLRAQTFSTPTSVFVSTEIKNRRETMLARIDPRGTNLSKIQSLNDILLRVVEGRVGPSRATRMVKRVIFRAPRYPSWMHILAYAVAATGVARFFGGGRRELMAAALTSLAVGSLAHAAARNRHAARVLEFLAGGVATVLASVSTAVLGPVSIELVTIAGLIVLMPGMMITTAMSELATRNLVSGTARFVGAITVVLSIGLGVAVGRGLCVHLPGGFDAAPVPLPGWTEILAAVVAPVGFVVLFNARARDTGVMVVAGAGTFVLARFATASMGLELGVCLSAAAIGVAGNLYARGRGRLAMTVVLPGLLMLVPGSLSFRSFDMFLMDDTITGVQTAFKVLVTALALVAGLLLANVAAAPRRSL